MPPYSQLKNFEVKVAPSGDTLILISGTRRYYDILRLTFPDYSFQTLFPARYGHRYDWGTYVKGIGGREQENICALLELLTETIYIEDALEQSFALSLHFKPFYEGKGRSEIGELVYQAKYNHDKSKAAELVIALENFIQAHPAYLNSDLLMAVPASNPNKPFDLPDFLADQLSRKLQIPTGKHLVQKTRQTLPMKDLTLEEKQNNIYRAFEVISPEALNGRLVTIIDDLYQSGTTINEFATALNQAGARVQSLTATKTSRDANK